MDKAIPERVVESVARAADLGRTAAATDAKYKDLSTYLDALPDATHKWGYAPEILPLVLRECHRLGLEP